MQVAADELRRTKAFNLDLDQGNGSHHIVFVKFGVINRETIRSGGVKPLHATRKAISEVFASRAIEGTASGYEQSRTVLRAPEGATT